MSPLQNVKWMLVEHLHLSKDSLHIYVALTLFLGSAMLLRWPIKGWRPWLLVLAAALAGEAWDLRDSIVYGTRLYLLANLKDVLNTILWPTVLMLLARHTRVLKRG
ncbi:hypothetical protein [Sphingomonas sp.]|jgi:hypothetical protein|uniref:hypothetical protein n=1 Tax=Sphingomonas sp. TaxID=28214 RepID=UPI002DE9E316|nr:hypothetical protein [Sphingomonas sp.]